MIEETKKCSRCKEFKSVNEFPKNKSKSDGLAWYCKKCTNETGRERYKNNAEKMRTRNKEYCKNHPDRIKKCMRKYYENNTEKVKARTKKWHDNNTEKIREMGKVWRSKNVEKIKSKGKRRRVFLRGIFSETIDSIHVYETHNWICGICGKKIDKKLEWPHPKSISLDHIIPISKGGTHIYSNVQPTHLRCNLSKFNRIENIQLKLQA